MPEARQLYLSLPFQVGRESGRVLPRQASCTAGRMELKQRGQYHEPTVAVTVMILFLVSPTELYSF